MVKHLCFGVALALLVLGLRVGDVLANNTYNDMLKRAAGEAKSAQGKSNEDSPVLVTYEVGDTGGFFSHSDDNSDENSDADWVEWEK